MGYSACFKNLDVESPLSLCYIKLLILRMFSTLFKTGSRLLHGLKALSYLGALEGTIGVCMCVWQRCSDVYKGTNYSAAILTREKHYRIVIENEGDSYSLSSNLYQNRTLFRKYF